MMKTVFIGLIAFISCVFTAQITFFGGIGCKNKIVSVDVGPGCYSGGILSDPY